MSESTAKKPRICSICSTPTPKGCLICRHCGAEYAEDDRAGARMFKLGLLAGVLWPPSLYLAYLWPALSVMAMMTLCLALFLIVASFFAPRKKAWLQRRAF